MKYSHETGAGQVPTLTEMIPVPADLTCVHGRLSLRVAGVTITRVVNRYRNIGAGLLATAFIISLFVGCSYLFLSQLAKHGW